MLYQRKMKYINYNKNQKVQIKEKHNKYHNQKFNKKNNYKNIMIN